MVAIDRIWLHVLDHPPDLPLRPKWRSSGQRGQGSTQAQASMLSETIAQVRPPCKPWISIVSPRTHGFPKVSARCAPCYALTCGPLQIPAARSRSVALKACATHPWKDQEGAEMRSWSCWMGEGCSSAGS